MQVQLISPQTTFTLQIRFITDMLNQTIIIKSHTLQFIRLLKLEISSMGK